jgi:L-lactate dehydrogenase complex protein LldG
MTAREAILAAVRRGRGDEPAPRHPLRPWRGEAVSQFAERARSAAADVYAIARMHEAPAAILSLLAAKNSVLRLHLPPASLLDELAWHTAPALTLTTAPPSGSDTAISIADFGIAETGTVVFLSGSQKPSSWHFLPGRELVLVRRETIVPRLEDVIDAISAQQMPATVNLVTGPSRTADIEQTIERGAHGPRELCILIVG